MPPSGRAASGSEEDSGATGKTWQRNDDSVIDDGRKEYISAGGGGSGRGRELKVLLSFVDLRLQFGWRRIPRSWGVITSAIEHAQRQMIRASVTILAVGVAATEHVLVVADTGVVAKPLPKSCTVGAEDTAYMVIVLDDAVSVERQWEPDGARWLALAQSPAWLHFLAMGGALSVAEEGHRLGTTATSTGIRPGSRQTDDFTAIQESQRASGAAGRVA